MNRTSLLLLFLAATPAAAARLETSVEPREVRVGDRLKLTVTVVPSPGEKPLPFEPPETWGSFELQSASSSGTVHVLTLTTFEVDKATIPALTFRYVDVKGSTRTLETPEIPVPLKSVLPPGTKDLKGLKGGLRPLPWNPWPWALAGFLFVAVAVLFIFWKRRSIFRVGAGAKALAPPDEEALRALEGMEALLGGPAKPYYSRLTDIFKVYIERRFKRAALDRTTEELIPILRSLPIDGDFRAILRDLLETADLAKFAQFESPSEERLRHRDRLKDFVLATREKPAEAPAR